MDWFAGFTLWHWVGLGIILLSFEVLIGTFDLLWVAMASFATALFVLVAPAIAPDIAAPGNQLAFFGAAAIALVILGRTALRDLRRPSRSHPHLNDRMTAMVGWRGEAAISFEHAHGRVKIGDTVWSAVQEDEAPIAAGDEVVVTGASGAMLKVRKS